MEDLQDVNLMRFAFYLVLKLFLREMSPRLCVLTCKYMDFVYGNVSKCHSSLFA